MIQFNDVAKIAGKISFNLLQKLNMAVNESIAFKKTKKLLEKGS